MRTNPRILLVEDDPSVAAALQNALESSGYSVETTDRANLGLTAASQREFDAVVTDLQVRDAKDGGLQVLETLHLSHPHLPVILMTGHHTADVAIAATMWLGKD